MGGGGVKMKYERVFQPGVYKPREGKTELRRPEAAALLCLTLR